MSFLKHLSSLLLGLLLFNAASGQSYILDMARQSARSDIRTGGEIEKAELEPYQGNLKLTINVPSFDMTLWQGDREIKKYYVGVGLKDFPIFVGLRDIDTIIWNPAWIPPASKWVSPALQGKVIGPSDSRNPLGKIKIPLGYGYLIHQAKGSNDLGSLVSHGCVRVMRNDLYDLNDKFLYSEGLDLKSEISRAKRTKRTFVIELEEPVDLEVTYDTMVVEAGILHIYPDVYGYRVDKIGDLRTELAAAGVDVASIPDEMLADMIAKAENKSQFVIGIDDIKYGNFSAGKVLPVVPRPKRSKKR